MCCPDIFNTNNTQVNLRLGIGVLFFFFEVAIVYKSVEYLASVNYAAIIYIVENPRISSESAPDKSTIIATRRN